MRRLPGRLRPVLAVVAIQLAQSYTPAIQPSTESSTPATAIFRRITTLEGELAAQNGWSPTGQRLAFLRKNRQLYVYDAATPERPAWAVMTEASRFIQWSPDGTWLACLRRPPSEARTGLSTIVACDVEKAGAVDTIMRGFVTKFAWAIDGDIYVWDSTGERRAFPPPSRWTGFAPTQVDKPVLVPVAVRGKGVTIHEFSPLAQVQRALPGLQSPNTLAAIPVEPFPDGQRYLVTLERDQRHYTAVIDPDGNLLADLGDATGSPGFNGISVSPDGQYVLGYHEINDGHRILDVILFVASTNGTWRVPLTPSQHTSDASFARSGNLIALRDRGGIVIGSLDINEAPLEE